MSAAGIIFDMDGTLWDSSEGVALSWNEVLLRHPEAARTVTRADVQSVMGMTMTAIADRLFGYLEKGARLALLKECEDHENEYLAEHGGQLYPGLEETLRTLSERYPLCIVSNCQSGYIEAFLGHYGFERYFRDYACFGDNGLPKAGNIREIARQNGLDVYYYVGDIQADCDAALAAGARFIHAAYGFGTVRESVPAVRAVTELPALMRQLEAE